MPRRRCRSARAHCCRHYEHSVLELPVPGALGQAAIRLRMVRPVEGGTAIVWESHGLPVPKPVSVDALLDGAGGLQADQALHRLSCGNAGPVWALCEVRWR